MYYKKKLGQIHFAGRFKESISSAKSAIEKYDYGGFSMRRYLDDAILMENIEDCFNYAYVNGANYYMLDLIKTRWYPNLVPNYSLSYRDLSNFNTLLGCITIKFPRTKVEIVLGEYRKFSIQELGDLVVKSCIKSVIKNSEDDFVLNIIRVKTNFGSVHRNFHSNEPDVTEENFNKLLDELEETKIDGYKFLFFYSGDWEDHLANFIFNE